MLSLSGMLATTAAIAVAQTRPGRIISQQLARQHGLERAWVTRVQLDSSRGRIANVSLYGDMLLVQSTRGLVHALHAESGRTLWTSRVGRRDYPSTRPAANGQFVALTNGSTLYVLDRATGLPKWDTRLGGSPSAGPSVGSNWVCVPLSNGIVEAHHLTDRDHERLIHAAAGIPETSPLATAESVICATTSGWIYSCVPNTMTARFRVETKRGIRAPLSYADPNVIAASRDGHVYAFHETEGDQVWRFSAGTAISNQPVVIGDAVYIIPEFGGMFQLSAQFGVERWWAPGIFQFIAASPSRIYAADGLGRTVVLDIKTGARLDFLPTGHLPVKMTNMQTDRIYLGTDDGIIQCLHEIELPAPVRHNMPPAEDGQPMDPAAGPGQRDAVPLNQPNNPPVEPPLDDNPFAEPAGNR